MSLSKSIGRYADIASVLEAIGDRKCASMSFETYGKAVQWRMRVYMYRKLLLEMEEEKFAHIPGHIAYTAYDDLEFKLKKNELIVHIERREQEGTLCDGDGEAIELKTAAPMEIGPETAGEDNSLIAELKDLVGEEEL